MVPSGFDNDQVLLTLSCGSSSSSSEAAPAAGTPPAQLAPPERLLRGRRRRRRGHQETSSFACRTCGREFSTFQALGGHRTSHLRRPATTKKTAAVVPVHACAACGLGFSTGEALGGHMRRHRGVAGPSTTEEEEEGCGGPGDVYAVDLAQAVVVLHERPSWPGDVYAVDLAQAVVVLHERPSSASLQLLDLFV